MSDQKAEAAPSAGNRTALAATKRLRRLCIRLPAHRRRQGPSTHHGPNLKQETAIAAYGLLYGGTPTRMMKWSSSLHGRLDAIAAKGGRGRGAWAGCWHRAMVDVSGFATT
jgi:hypothetical protein